jgi:preprotein translocase subunit SecE
LQVRVLSALHVDAVASAHERYELARTVHDEPSEDIVANAKRDRAAKRNPFSRIALFVRQVFGELRKVITPTRKELLTYTGVVLVFVIIMMGIVFGLDQLFGWLVLLVFGSPSS